MNLHGVPNTHQPIPWITAPLQYACSWRKGVIKHPLPPDIMGRTRTYSRRTGSQGNERTILKEMLKVGNEISLHAFGLQPLWEAEVLPSKQIHQQQHQRRSSGTCKMAMTLFNNHCEPCSKSELDLESLPPVQVGIIDDYVVSTGPKSALSGNNPLEFEISASGDDYRF